MTSDVPMDHHENVPLACSLTAGELRVRGEENASLFARAHDVQELPDGYRFAFPAGADGVSELLRFILAERACCPFFTFELTFPSPHQTVWLAVRGGEGVKEIVRYGLLPKVILDARGMDQGARDGDDLRRRSGHKHARLLRARGTLALVRARLRFLLRRRVRLWMAGRHVALRGR
jgi:hypothetical protein